MPRGETIKFNIEKGKEEEIKIVLKAVYKALEEKDYNPINQIVGYIISGDPTYITSYNNARSMITRIDKDDLLEELTKSYLRDHCGIKDL